MLKRCVFIIILVFGLGFAAAYRGMELPKTQVKLYFVDSDMMRLLPRRVEITALTPQKEGQKVLDLLIEGDDDNEKVFRTIPKVPRGLGIRVKNEVATVDIKQELIDAHAKDRNTEVLTIYSIVNSLVSVDGIKAVKFTVEGEVQKDFIGFIDMREMFIFDEYV